MNLTPKEQAQELYDKIHFTLPSYHDEGQQEHIAAKECALIVVDVIQKLPNIQYDSIQYNNNDESQYDYWQEVKQEIEKL